MAAIRRWLESRNVYPQNDWLEACINFVKEDNEERQLSSAQLNELVYEQWLMAEIEESSVPRLPEGLGNRDSCKLEGNFNLQINSILNVGESAYSQIQKLKGQDDPQELNFKANPSEPKIKSSRMLLLELTDGAQSVFGMEYQLIPFLKVTTPPGTKIQVSGHITCRLGALLLTPSNVKVLGGNVMHLMEGNSYWNILHQSIGQDPPEKPSVIKTECLSSNEESNFNQITIQDDRRNNVTTSNNQRVPIKTETTSTTISAGFSNNNRTGNATNSPENRGQIKQQGPKGNRGINGVVSANSSRDFKSYGCTNNKLENFYDQDFFDDDDEILAAVADEDFLGQEEDFDMEEIDQLETGMQNTNGRTDKRTTMSNVTHENSNVEMPYDDGMFEDDFGAEDLLAEAADSFEIKPLHERIGSGDNMNGSKKPRISNSSTMKFNSHLRNTSSSNNNNFQTGSAVNRSSARDTSGTLNIVKTEPVSLMNNATFNSCSVVINTGACCKPKNAGALKLSSNKTNVARNSNVYNSTRPLSSQTSGIQIKKESENDNVPPVVAGRGQYQRTSMHNTLTGIQDPDYDSAPFQYLSEVLKYCPVREKCTQTSGIQIKKESENDNVPPVVAGRGQYQRTSMHNTLTGIQDPDYDSAPFQYLSEVLKYCPVREKCTVRVKAYIATVLSRRQPMSPKWNVTVKLNDGTASVDADLSDKVLTELLEYPVDKYRLEIQQAMRSKDLALCEILHKRTGQFERNLASTSGLMDLQFTPDTPRPRVLHLTQATSRDVSEMICRVSERF